MQNDVKQVTDRCNELGISLESAQAIGNESGYCDVAAVCWAIGLDPATLLPLRQKNWAVMAASTSSVSYRRRLPAETLISILATGEVPTVYVSQISHLLDHAPAQILVMAAEQAGLQTNQPMADIWTNILNLMTVTGSHRPGAWKIPR